DFCSKNYESHVLSLVKELKRKCDIMIQALEIEFGSIAEFYIPKGGIFIWITFPSNINTNKLYEVALKKGIALNPGSEWVSNPSDGINKIRLCFANPSEKIIKKGISQLAEICFQEFGLPNIRANIKR
ncbi:MAG: PLP-dependent aminotransferase family protein, partial [Pelagibacterales bacterium]|nr:PLP-dependent aminotransferase family protein [Pelagibacterales bacterium]